MNLSELQKMFPSKVLDKHLSANPLSIAEQMFFDNGSCNYKEAAIVFMRNERIGFESTCNSIYELFERLVSIECLYCKKKMDLSGASGNTNVFNIKYLCKKCGSVVTLKLDHNSLSVSTPTK